MERTARADGFMFIVRETPFSFRSIGHCPAISGLRRYRTRQTACAGAPPASLLGSGWAPPVDLDRNARLGSGLPSGEIATAHATNQESAPTAIFSEQSLAYPHRRGQAPEGNPFYRAGALAHCTWCIATWVPCCCAGSPTCASILRAVSSIIFSIGFR